MFIIRLTWLDSLWLRTRLFWLIKGKVKLELIFFEFKFLNFIFFLVR